MTVFDAQGAPKPAKALAYGGVPQQQEPTDAGQLYRLERAQPYYRAGQLVYAVPQFRAISLYSPTTKNAILPKVTSVPVQIKYPTAAK